MVAARGQSAITGSITDPKGQPIVYATVALLSVPDSALVKGNITNETGVYELSELTPGHYVLRATYIGYKTGFSKPFSISAQPATTTLDKIVLAEEVNALQEVTVVAQRQLIEKQADRLVMNLGNSVLAQGVSAKEVLRSAPLVAIDREDKITVRGKPNVMILVDGRTLPNTTLGAVLQNLPADQIEKIEVITNPSARYDAAASGGVINIVTKQGLQYGLTGNVRSAYARGLRGRFNTGTDLNYRGRKYNLLGTLGYLDATDLRRDFYQRDFLNLDQGLESTVENEVAYRTLSGKFGMDYFLNDRHTVGFFVDNYTYGTGIDFQTNTRFYSAAPIDSGVVTRADYDFTYQLNNFNASYKGVFNDRGQELSFNATHTRYRQTMEQLLDVQTVDAQGEPRDSRRISTYTPSRIGITIAQADYVHPLTTHLKVEAGLKFTQIRTGNDFTQETSAGDGSQAGASVNEFSGYTESISAGYGSISTRFDKVSVQAGLRAEQTNAEVRNANAYNYFDLFPSLSVGAELSDNHSITLSYSRRIDRPAYGNLIPFRVFNDPFTIREGNPLLRPQYSNVTELSSTFGNVTLMLGYTRTRDAMLDSPLLEGDRTVVYRFRNFSLFEGYNLSVVIPLQIAKWWQTSSTLTGFYNSVEASNQDIAAFETEIRGVTVNTTNTFLFDKGIKGELTGSYSSAGQYGIYRVMPLYSLNLGIGKEVLKSRGFVKLSFSDVFWSDRPRVEARIGDIRDYSTNYNDSRRVLLSFNYKFGKPTVKAVNSKSLGNENERKRIN